MGRVERGRLVVEGFALGSTSHFFVNNTAYEGPMPQERIRGPEVLASPRTVLLTLNDIALVYMLCRPTLIGARRGPWRGLHI